MVAGQRRHGLGQRPLGQRAAGDGAVPFPPAGRGRKRLPGRAVRRHRPVSYAHLDVYKRQGTDDAVTGGTAYYTIHVNTAGEVLDVAFNDGTFVCLYKDGEYTVGKKTDKMCIRDRSNGRY